MFYADFILNSNDNLSKVWLAAHWNSFHRCRKKEIITTDIDTTVNELISLNQPVSLRVSSQLLFGASRIYSKQVEYLYFDSESVANYFKKAQNKIKKRKKVKRIFSELSLKELSSNLNGSNSQEEEDIIMRGSQRKMAREEDITLPGENINKKDRNNQNFIEEDILNSQTDPIAELETDSVEMPRIAPNNEEIPQVNVLNENQPQGSELSSSIINLSEDRLDEIANENDEEDRFYDLKKEKMIKKRLLMADTPTNLRRVKVKTQFGHWDDKKDPALAWRDICENFKTEIRKCLLIDDSQILFNCFNRKRKIDQRQNEEEKRKKRKSPIKLEFGEEGEENNFFPEDDSFQGIKDSQFEFSGENNSSDREEMVIEENKNEKGTKRTKKMFELIKETKEKKENIRFGSIVNNVSRKTAAGMFYELLNLRSKSLIQCSQEEMLGEIKVTLA